MCAGHSFATNSRTMMNGKMYLCVYGVGRKLFVRLRSTKLRTFINRKFVIFTKHIHRFDGLRIGTNCLHINTFLRKNLHRAIKAQEK